MPREIVGQTHEIERWYIKVAINTSRSYKAHW